MYGIRDVQLWRHSFTGDPFLYSGYSPDLNPDGEIWNHLKRVELGNVCCADLGQLRTEIIRAKERLRHKRELTRSCSRQCG